MNKPRGEEIQVQSEIDSRAGGRSEEITPFSYKALGARSKLLAVLKPEDLIKHWKSIDS